ncbi:ATP-dependent DNA helicase RecG [Bacillus massiliigorillae]|uniref:ATP-dependent DNA helicase RecG n=1 Tax=Bacillus massiliigorillae TaxID=1243664 RepID=UPI00039ACF17|nr:ATP-dependent DNA helicase RecG [Bacillus massiliigorillae]
MMKQSHSVAELKGVGPETSEALKEMGILTVSDLLEYLPYRYEDFRLKDLEEAAQDERVTVEGVIHSTPSTVYYAKKKTRLSFKLLVDRYLVTVVFFNQPYLKKKFELHQTVTITGKWDRNRQTITANDFQIGQNKQQQTFEPVYSTKGSVTVKGLRKFIGLAFSQFENEIVETLPEYFMQKYKLLTRKQALRAMHFPMGENDLKQARRRIAYEELLLFQLKMQALRRIQRQGSAGISHTYDNDSLTNYMESLPFPLTSAQSRVVQEILQDMKSPHRMNRLLQGDVGSGKTVVATIALLASVTSGYQGALMVPTEILAEQHAASIQELLKDTGVKTALFTSSVKGKKRRELLEALKAGEIDILIGTHALIGDEVFFNRLGLVITDEQHRFGVKQRRILREKGENPDVLFMTATPIPRTLAITVFGEMDVSIIDEMPAGRKQIETYWAKHNMLDRVLGFMEKELQKGRQAYVICPLIEESEKLDLQNAIEVHDMLVQYFGTRYQIGLMHGKLPTVEKDEVMRQFSDNQSQVLVSTTVVEVGVNVPNATFMFIYDAERFGLSQLHQLRGRVGRGSEQSYCVLVSDAKSENGKERMRIMTETNDGFVLSEKDLELRGPGDFFGRKQSGLPEFKVADLVHDYRMLEVARDDASQLINSNAFWEEEHYAQLRAYLDSTGILAQDKLD